MPGETMWPTLLYVPNLVGYARIVLCAIALAHFEEPRRFVLYYITSFLLDAADGYLARAMNQSSKFGALLDMITDRCATGALLAVLAHLYDQPGLFLPLLFLDGVSHWMQMFAGVCEKTKSHKDAGRSWLLRFYYKRPVLAFVCLFNELFLVVLYMMRFKGAWSDGVERLLPTMAMATMPVFVIKQLVSCQQILSAHLTLVDPRTWES
eukprot:Plantae.Rhodophyta-Rhodochaete_pulchella.ctg7787.p2 GENE.Plantae.Rhodophyta-Rhodochaete_pulchella.ctg7787~~Plantae.Rhodophyta-Rhodochaete_pulchella.ctg7787.p2  ORF type:complete len:208 (+),score=23.82 Plantae.Rhodophyta-Rhodochaete_pulchella.ctg7787:3971-4594(+)